METIVASLSVDRWGGPPLSIQGCELRERLSEPYRIELDVVVGVPDATVAGLLGSSATLQLKDGEAEHTSVGIVTWVRASASHTRDTRISLVVEPALAALKHRSDSRIFQEKTTPEILQEVLGAGLGPFGRGIELALNASYPVREYTVQYKETDYDFAHRLMEEDGIGYLFDHTGAAETLVLFDSNAVHETVGGSPLRYDERQDAAKVDHGTLPRFDEIAQVRTNQVAGRHFDWTHPSFPIEATVAAGAGGLPPLERYVHDAPLTFHGYASTYGEHNASAQATVYAEREARDARLSAGGSSNLALRAGRRFALLDHPSPASQGEWVLAEVVHRFGDRASKGVIHYENDFEALPFETPWRPDRQRERPRVFGVQTATVVGAAAEEIYCDEHGRVKVQFHWDRQGAMDDHSSCWIRVVQTMGGANWGFSFIPRVGMEVVVTFVEGNPDAPLVTGVVYNAANPPPFEFPADKTRTTIRTQSSPGGAGFNELRFEDRAGEEEVYLKAEKDWETLVQNDLKRVVQRNETQEVVVDRARRVGQDERVAIGRDRTHEVAKDELLAVGANRTQFVQDNEQVTVGQNREKKIGANETVAIGQNALRTIGAELKEAVGGSLSQSVAKDVERIVGASSYQAVGGDKTTSVVGAAAFTVGGAVTSVIGTKFAQTIGDSFERIVKKNFRGLVKGSKTEAVGGHSEFASTTRSATIAANDETIVSNKSSLSARKVDMKGTKSVDLSSDDVVQITAGRKIELTVGQASLTMDNTGKIELKGVDVTVATALGEVHIQPGGIVAINGNMVRVNS